jgi:hydrogenase nickel incorporation protein HypA/HybF
MHEVGIAQRLIESAAEAMPTTPCAQVTALHVQLGPLAGVSEEELRFGFEVAAMGTPFAGALLAISRTPVVIYCPLCQQEFALPEPILLRCPVCGASLVRIVRGQEITLRAIELCDNAAGA